MYLLSLAGLTTNFDIIKIIVYLTFILGIIIIIGFHTFSSSLKHNYLNFKNNFTDDNKYLAVINEEGLWIKDEVEDKINIINAEIIEKNITSKSENISNARLSHYPNFIEASEKAINSVVHIKSKYLSNEIYGYYDPFYGRRYYKQPQENIASGSGVIISNDGYIITNNHVINNAKEIEIVLNDKRTYSAEILGVDPDSDLALLKIDEENLNFLKFADSDFNIDDVTNTFDVMLTKAIGDIFPAIDPNRSLFINMSYEHMS